GSREAPLVAGGEDDCEFLVVGRSRDEIRKLLFEKEALVRLRVQNERKRPVGRRAQARFHLTDETARLRRHEGERRLRLQELDELGPGASIAEDDLHRFERQTIKRLA